MSTFGNATSFSLDRDYLIATAATARIIESATAFFKFESFPLVDSLSQRQMVSIGSDLAVLDSGAFGKGLSLRSRSIYSFDLSLGSTTNLSVGFWLLPAYIEPTVDSTTLDVKYYRQAVLDKSMYYFDTPSGFILPENDSFSFYEESVDDRKNVMRIALRGTDDVLVIFSSEQYTTGEFHYFWFAYNGAGQVAKLFVDGKESQLTIEQGTEVPVELAHTPTTPFHINLSGIGNGSLLRGNSGLIDEVIIMSQSYFDEDTIGRHINLGSEFAINGALLTRNEVSVGFAFDDPTALSLNAVYSNGKNIYLGRSDGKLFRGDRLLWQARKDFANKDEIDFLRSNILGDDSIISIGDGALTIKKASVRI